MIPYREPGHFHWHGVINLAKAGPCSGNALRCLCKSEPRGNPLHGEEQSVDQEWRGLDPGQDYPHDPRCGQGCGQKTAPDDGDVCDVCDDGDSSCVTLVTAFLSAFRQTVGIYFV